MTEFNGNGDDESELSKAFGNVYLLQRDGEVDRIPQTKENALAYEYGYENFVTDTTGSETITFEVDGEVIQIESTNRADVYAIRIGDGRVVRNNPVNVDRVYQGIYEVENETEGYILFDLYDELRETHVDYNRAKELQERYAVIPPVSVEYGTRGWIIEDMFLLTWYNSVYLINRDFNEQPYSLRSMKETRKDIEFIGLELDDSDFTGGFEHEQLDECVSEKLMVFFYKAFWLVSHREQYPDKVFWSLINQYIQEDRRKSQDRGEM